MPIQLPHVPNPRIEDSYTYTTKRGKPLLFQVTDPMKQPLFPYLLAMHVNPSEFSENYAKSKTVAMTYGGFVEWNWPDELDGISASSSTGAFVGPMTGLTSGSDGTSQVFAGPSFAAGDPGRQATMAWERQEDLLDLFRGNGQIYDGNGRPVLRGRVMVIFDRGIYMGLFQSLEIIETDDKAFSFELSWEFKVEETVYLFPGSNNRVIRPGDLGSRQTKSQGQISAELDLVSGTGDFAQDQAQGEPPSPPDPPVQREGETAASFAQRQALFEAAYPGSSQAPDIISGGG